MSISIWVFAIALITSFQKEVLPQVLPPYGGAPVPYINNEDDDLGLLLTILLLAGRNKGGCGGCSCCSCCNCGNTQNIPIPFPIPIPTNNPIVNKCGSSADYSDDDDRTEKPNKIYIDIVKSNDD